MQQLPLFVFGTLRRGECNHHYLAGAYDRMVPARLPGFARVEPLMIARQADSVVEGELYFLTPAIAVRTLQGCDELEELPVDQLIGREYRRVPVKTQTDDGDVIAWAYVRSDNEPDADLRPLLETERQRLASGTFGEPNQPEA